MRILLVLSSKKYIYLHHTVILRIARVKAMRVSEVLMSSGSVFHTWGATYMNDCNP